MFKRTLYRCMHSTSSMFRRLSKPRGYNYINAENKAPPATATVTQTKRRNDIAHRARRIKGVQYGIDPSIVHFIDNYDQLKQTQDYLEDAAIEVVGFDAEMQPHFKKVINDEDRNLVSTWQVYINILIIFLSIHIYIYMYSHT